MSYTKRIISRLKKILMVNKYIENEFLIPKSLKSYKEWRQPGIDERFSGEFSLERIGITNFAIINKIKELEIKEKIRRNNKIRVAFILDTIAKFKTISVYHEMLSSDIFEPFIVLYHTFEYHINNDNVWDAYNNEYSCLMNKGYAVYHGYDENRKYIDFSIYTPDMVVVSSLYFDKIYTFVTQTYLNINYLVCIFNYGFSIIAGNAYNYYYNNLGVNTAWKHFMESQIDYAEIMRYSKHFGSNCVFFGAPSLDLYKHNDTNFKVPDKINNGKPIVIYAPHHTVHGTPEGFNLATFHIYHNYFLNMVESNPDINFVFKPHPSLGYKLKIKNVMDEREYNDYIHKWNSFPNAISYFDGDYINLFKISDLLITDSASFIVEWLPSKQPCMYLVNPERDRDTYLEYFSRLARTILEKYYLCYDEQNIAQYFRQIIFDKYDPLREERIKLIDTLFINIGTAGKKIVEYLTRILSS